MTETWTLRWTFLVVSQQRKHSTSVKLIKINFLSINITTILCKLLTRIENNQLVKMSKCLETQDLVVRSLDFRMEKSALECPLWIVVLHLRCNEKKKKKRKNWWSVCKTKNLKVKWKLSRRQEAFGLRMMRVLKITGTKIRKKKEKKTYYVHMLFRKM